MYLHITTEDLILANKDLMRQPIARHTGEVRTSCWAIDIYWPKLSYDIKSDHAEVPREKQG